MKTKDIIADGATVYAYAKDWEWKTTRNRTRSARPVLVTATGQRRKVYSYGSLHVADGIAITFVNDDGTPRTKADGTPVTDVVRPAEIRELWSEFKPAADAAEKARKADLARRVEEQNATRARLNEIFDRLPEDVHRPYWTKMEIHRDMSMTVKGDLTGRELADLLEAAYEAGRKAGS